MLQSFQDYFYFFIKNTTNNDIPVLKSYNKYYTVVAAPLWQFLLGAILNLWSRSLGEELRLCV